MSSEPGSTWTSHQAPDGRWVHVVTDEHYGGEVYTLDPNQPVRRTREGFDIVVMPWSFAGAQLSISSGAHTGFWLDSWCYESGRVGEALAAAEAWNPMTEAEPAGWNRHPASGRRRPDGTAASEFIRP